jgi:uncharacterized Zn-binding protein involved in type VI secretion
MCKSIIHVGDKTSHGGTVISGDMTWGIYGKPVARAGDLTVCPKCKGTFANIEGAGDLTSFGQAMARESDKTACGAILIASQFSTWWDNQETPGGANPFMGEPNTKAIAQEAPSICLECLASAAAAGRATIVRSTGG